MLQTIMLQAAPAASSSAMSGIAQFLPIILIFVIFYFFMIRPQQKKQKEINNFRNTLKAGDQVVTAGGIYGKIKEVNDNVITLEIANNVHIKIDKNSVYASANQEAK